jgi:hypothetical protein
MRRRIAGAWHRRDMISFDNALSRTVIRGDWKEAIKDAAMKTLKVLVVVCRVLKKLHHKPAVGAIGVGGCAKGSIWKWRADHWRMAAGMVSAYPSLRRLKKHEAGTIAFLSDVVRNNGCAQFNN